MGLSPLNLSSGGFSSGDSSGVSGDSENLDTGTERLFQASNFSSLIADAQQKLQQKISNQNLLSSSHTELDANGSSLSALSQLGKDSDVESISKTIFSLLSDPVVVKQLNISTGALNDIQAIETEFSKQNTGLTQSIEGVSKTLSTITQTQTLSLEQKDMMDARLTTLKDRARKIQLSSLLALEATLEPDQLKGLLGIATRALSHPSSGSSSSGLSGSPA